MDWKNRRWGKEKIQVGGSLGEVSAKTELTEDQCILGLEPLSKKDSKCNEREKSDKVHQDWVV